MESETWQHVEHPASSIDLSSPVSKPQHTKGEQNQPPAPAPHTSDSSASAGMDDSDVVLLPTTCELTLSISTDKQSSVMHVGAHVKVDRVQLQVHRDQIADVAHMQDQYAVWTLRNQYATLRPTGWRSCADTAVTPRQGT